MTVMDGHRRLPLATIICLHRSDQSEFLTVTSHMHQSQLATVR